MLKVNFPKTKVPFAIRLRNLVKTKGDILTPKERKYAQELTNEIRENINPWEKQAGVNDAILANIQDEFVKKVKKEEPWKYRGIVRNVKDYVYKEAQYHFDRMSEPFIQSKLTDVEAASGKVLAKAMERNASWKKLEKIYGEPVSKDASWQEIEAKLREKHFNGKQRNKCKFLYKQAYMADVQRVDNVIERENQIAANEAAAKQYGYWKSYDYVYNMPSPQK